MSDRHRWSNPRTRYKTKLTCHMCAVHEGFGRDIKVIGIYSICRWCFENIIPKFAAAFDDLDEGDTALVLDKK